MLDRDFARVKAKFFLALGDETRLRIIAVLREKGRMNVGELCNELTREQSHVSHHLACLRNCGIVKTDKSGKYVYYSLNGSQRIKRMLAMADEHVREAFENIIACEVVS
jgi:DNA-binding transcriptional ArsR family regulator